MVSSDSQLNYNKDESSSTSSVTQQDPTASSDSQQNDNKVESSSTSVSSNTTPETPKEEETDKQKENPNATKPVSKDNSANKESNEKKEQPVETIENSLIIENVYLGINANEFTVNEYAEEHKIYNESQELETMTNHRFFDKKDLQTDESNKDLIAVYFDNGQREDKKTDNTKYTLEELKNLGNGASKMYIFWKKRNIISDQIES
ncbi:MAG: hypothetical protein AB3N34_02735 [Lettuce witches'-broom phytoplasma]